MERDMYPILIGIKRCKEKLAQKEHVTKMGIDDIN